MSRFFPLEYLQLMKPQRKEEKLKIPKEKTVSIHEQHVFCSWRVFVLQEAWG